MFNLCYGCGRGIIYIYIHIYFDGRMQSLKFTFNLSRTKVQRDVILNCSSVKNTRMYIALAWSSLLKLKVHNSSAKLVRSSIVVTSCLPTIYFFTVDNVFKVAIKCTKKQPLSSSFSFVICQTAQIIFSLQYDYIVCHL